MQGQLKSKYLSVYKNDDVPAVLVHVQSPTLESDIEGKCWCSRFIHVEHITSVMCSVDDEA